MEKIIAESITRHREALHYLEISHKIIADIASLFISVLENKGKIIFFGNGGSAADAQHLAAELVGRFKKKRSGLAALALSTNTSIITAVGNDFGFENIFVRQIESLAKSGDLAVGLSTSGKSENVIRAIKKSQELGLKSVGFLGKDGGDLVNITDVSLSVPVFDTPCIQEMHILAGHIICEIVDEHFAEK